MNAMNLLSLCYAGFVVYIFVGMAPPLSIRGSSLDIGGIWDDQMKQVEQLLSQVEIRGGVHFLDSCITNVYSR